jgi:endonuclease III
MALVAFIIGISVNRPCAARINKISQAIAQQGTPPTPDQQKELMMLRGKIF